VKNGSGGTLRTLSSDGNSSSRLGFRGVEDLGGGMKASFWLEAGLGIDTGSVGAAGGGFFNRRATASLSGDFGEVRLGRDNVPTYIQILAYDIFNPTAVGGSLNTFQPGTTAPAGNTAFVAGGNTNRVLGVPSTATGDARTGAYLRADNSVGYFLPSNLGGVYGQVMVAAGEGLIGNKTTGALLGYAAGPLRVSVALNKTSLFTNSLKAASVGGSFNAGFATFNLMYNDYKVGSGEPASATSYGIPGGRSQKNFMLAALVPLGQGNLKLGYTDIKGDLNATNATASPTVLDAKATQFAIGYEYNLSKRTALYASTATLRNKNGAHFYVTGNGPAIAVGSTGVVPNFSSTGYEFGLRHSF
jgi:predicted porin